MAVQCIGGIEAVEYFESLPIPAGQETLREHALNRIKYEVAKGVGVKVKTTKAVYRWHSDIQNCGNCGYSGVRPQEHYCPNCGTAYLRNEYTEQKVKQFEADHQITLAELIAGGA